MTELISKSSEDCYIPQKESDIRSLEQLNQMVGSHDWVYSHAEKWGTGLLFFMSCERCGLKRTITMISTGIMKDQESK